MITRVIIPERVKETRLLVRLFVLKIDEINYV